MKEKNILLIIAMLCSFWHLEAQDNPVFIPSNILEESFIPAQRMCELLETKKNDNVELNRKILENTASNGVVVKWLEHNNDQYSQRKYNYMLLKVYSESFMNCDIFRDHYYLIFDSESVNNTELKEQHKGFTNLLYEFIERDTTEKVKKLMQSAINTFGTVKHINENKYKLIIYEYLPDSGPSYPLSTEILVADYKFEINDNVITLLEAKEDETKIFELLSKNTNTPPPPPMPIKH
jgi:hypothetical protein